MTPDGHIPVKGSERAFSAGHERVGPVDEREQVTVTVYLRPSGSLDWIAEQEQRPLGEQRRMSREEWAQAHGASDADIAAVREFATAHHLRVDDESPARRAMKLTGTLASIVDAFGVQELALFRHPDGTVYRGRSGELSLPATLSGIVVGVFGIDNRPQAKPHFRSGEPSAASAVSYTPIQVAEAYDFPRELGGKGETIAVIELGGGYSETELARYFSNLGVGPVTVENVGVDGGANTPGEEADIEVMLDIEVIGSLAPEATIVVYFASNTGDQGFLDAVSQAVHDTANAPSVVSISWGGPEDQWSQQGREQMEQIFTEAAALGVTVTVAAGDHGSTDGVEDRHQHVDFPASAPHALACGGTSLQAQGAAIVSETVWNDGGLAKDATGGGVSIEFEAPAYQPDAQATPNVDTGKPGRGVPDVAGDADLNTGYKILAHGEEMPVGGTSAVAPLWAALVARFNQSLGKSVGFLQPQIYSLPQASVFHEITETDNGKYKAHAGWNACTGLGSPKGAALLQALQASVAGAAPSQPVTPTPAQPPSAP